MYQCIYCPTTSQKRFRREHVMPESFGKFRSNLTIFCVCDTCNSFFGDTIERTLSRDTIFGLLRIQHGLKPVNKVHQIGRKITTTVTGDKTLEGVPLRFEDLDGRLSAMHENVVGFEHPDGHVDWHRYEDLTQEIASRYRPFYRTRILAGDDDLPAIMERLKAIGVPMERPETFELPAGDVGTVSTGYFGDDELRVIAKIAFNYAAYVLPTALLLGSEFNTVRRWIRYGELPGRVVVAPSDGPRMRPGSELRGGTHRHLLTISWADSQTLVVHIRMFNRIGFAVELCSRFEGVWFPVASGHHFDLRTRSVAKLRAFPRRLLL